MAKYHLVQIDAALRVGGCELHCCDVPRDAIEALPDHWQLCDPGSYDPVTFNEAFGVPEELNSDNRVVERGDHLIVAGDEGEHMFYFKFERRATVTEYETLSKAIGAFVQGEMAACLLNPSALMRDDDLGGNESLSFDLFKFEDHLKGLLSDLVYCCSYDPAAKLPMYDNHVGPVNLIIVPAAPHTLSPPDHDHEWQCCAQGFARIEAV